MPLARAWSTGGTTLRQLALEAMLQLLQPIVILEAPVPAPILRGASLSAAAARAAAATATAPGPATAGSAAGATAMQQSGTQEDAEAEAVAEVGRAFGPSSVTAAMYLLSKGATGCPPAIQAACNATVACLDLQCCGSLPVLCRQVHVIRQAPACDDHLNTMLNIHFVHRTPTTVVLPGPTTPPTTPYEMGHRTTNHSQTTSMHMLIPPS